MTAEETLCQTFFDLGIIIQRVHLQSSITFQETGIPRKNTKHNWCQTAVAGIRVVADHSLCEYVLWVSDQSSQ